MMMRTRTAYIALAGKVCLRITQQSYWAVTLALKERFRFFHVELDMLRGKDQVFETVRSLQNGEYILFKRKNKSEMGGKRASDAGTEEMGEEDEASGSLLEDLSPSVTNLLAISGPSQISIDSHTSKQRKVAKLAHLFGVTPDNKNTLKEGTAELEDLLNMLSENMESLPTSPVTEDFADAQDTFSDIVPKLQRQAVPENTICKEGWLAVEGPDPTTETTAWVSLEKGAIHVRICESRETAISPKDPVVSTMLRDVVVDCPFGVRPAFVLRSAKSNSVMYVFTAASQQDRDDWVQTLERLIDVISKQPPPRTGLSQNSKGSSTPASPSLQTRVPGLPEGGVPRTVSTRSRARSQRATIDDFEFHRVLGKGKYGKVLLCSHKISKTVFAIKVVQRDPESEDTARTESEILRSIKHPFIVGLHFAVL